MKHNPTLPTRALLVLVAGLLPAHFLDRYESFFLQSL